MDYLRRRFISFLAALPLALFIYYSQQEGDLYRRMTFGSMVALPVLVYFAATRRWMSPILIGTYCFWVVVYLAFALQPDWLVDMLEVVRETGIFICMGVAAILLACFSRFGAVGFEGTGRAALTFSSVMVAAMGLAIVSAAYFAGDETLAIVYPSVALVILQFVLYRLGTRREE